MLTSSSNLKLQLLLEFQSSIYHRISGDYGCSYTISANFNEEEEAELPCGKMAEKLVENWATTTFHRAGSLRCGGGHACIVAPHWTLRFLFWKISVSVFRMEGFECSLIVFFQLNSGCVGQQKVSWGKRDDVRVRREISLSIKISRGQWESGSD
jgi:hypothetical protein